MCPSADNVQYISWEWQTGGRAGHAYRQRLAAAYKALATQYKVPLLPFLLEGVALQPGMMQADGLHPTAQAQPKVLDNVWPLLRPLL